MTARVMPNVHDFLSATVNSLTEVTQCVVDTRLPDGSRLHVVIPDITSA